MTAIDGQPGSWPADRVHQKPGKAVKFAVVDPSTGNVSSTWRVWTGKKVDDVYLLEVTSGGMWKISHHNDAGMWRLAMTREGAAGLGVERQVVDDWARQPPEQGWSEGVGVLVPVAYLRPPTGPLTPSVIQVPTSALHSGIAIRLYFEEVGAVGFEFPAAYPVAVLARMGGGRVYVVAEPVKLGFDQHEVLASLCIDARESMPDGTNLSGRFVGAIRMEEQRVVVDLTVD